MPSSHQRMELDRSNSNEDSSLPRERMTPFEKGFDKVARGAITRSRDGTSPSLSAQRVVDIEARLQVGKPLDPLAVSKEVEVQTEEEWDADEEEEGEISRGEKGYLAQTSGSTPTVPKTTSPKALSSGEEERMEIENEVIKLNMAWYEKFMAEQSIDWLDTVMAQRQERGSGGYIPFILRAVRGRGWAGPTVRVPLEAETRIREGRISENPNTRQMFDKAP
ncbi:hypothetical protein U1Q18_032708 [Sarracenia purpurea var. burkii]